MKLREKIANVLGYIYGIGIAISLFVGGISAVGYIVAIIVGGPTASAICEFIYKGVYPVLIYFASCVVILGLVKMYVAGEKSLSLEKKKKAK